MTEQRETCTTEEFAVFVGVKATTIRRAYCVTGHYLNLRPTKLPNKRLLWSAAEVRQLMGKGA